MKVNYKKIKFIVFHPCTSRDFFPEFEYHNHTIELTESIILLEINPRSDLNFIGNTTSMTKWAFARLWIIKRLKNMGASWDYPKNVYEKQVRSVLEFGVPVWNSSITKQEVVDWEILLPRSKIETISHKPYSVSYQLAEKHDKIISHLNTVEDGES